MEYKKYSWMVFLLPILLGGAIGCTATKEQLRAEPSIAKAAPGEATAEPAKELAAAPLLPSEMIFPKEQAKVPPAERIGEQRILAQQVESQPVAAPPAVPPSLSSPVSRVAEPPRNSRFVLNFDNADLYEVIRVMSEMLKINYIIDPKVRGVVNIHTVGQISTEEIFPIFQSILKLNGATAVQRGIVHEIVPFGDAKKLYTPPLPSQEAGKPLTDERYIIHIVPLKYIPVTEVSKIIKPFLSDGADIIEHPPSNILIMGDVVSNIKKSLDMIGLFDVDIFTDMRVRIYPILNADVSEVAKEMERIFSSFEVSTKSGRGVGITFTPIVRINSLLAVSSIPQIFDKVERWLKELDRIPGEGTQLNVFVYYVQNAKAKDLAEVLKQVYAPPKAARPDLKERVLPPTPAPTAPTPRGVRPSPTPAAPGVPTPPATPGIREEAGGIPEGEINIVVDETTNSLIIRAYHRDYKAIVETIKKLDIYPKQVLIEVLLAEVTLDDTTKYGLEWSTFTNSFARDGRTYSYTLGMGGITPQATMVTGLRYAITSVDRLAAAISLSATEDRLKVISSPHIMASNNKEARIQIGRSEPILTNTYTTTGTSTPGVVEGTIEYKDIGIILTVTPRISDGRLVTLDISIEQSTVGKTALGNLQDVPFFPKKTAKTTLSIMERQTIVIGGLIEDRKEAGSAGVPFLSKIPILGALFGYQTRIINKTETVLFLTPHVIGDLGDSNRVTEEFREKIHSIQKALELQKQEQDKQKTKERSSVKPEAPRVGVTQPNPTVSGSP